MVNKNRDIVDCLKRLKRASTSRIAGYIGASVGRTKILMERLYEEKKVEKIEETIATYWVLK